LVVIDTVFAVNGLTFGTASGLYRHVVANHALEGLQEDLSEAA
jgi:hypothetical protein|tara:strand:- start:114 stop:242 length:129 start_codon:yes stop_codon:yes gene_type:complete